MAEPTIQVLTRSVGSDDWNAKLFLVAYPDNLRHTDKDRPVCELASATYDVRQESNAVPLWRFYTTLPGVVDFEHDTSKFALVELTLPYVIRDYWGVRTIVGVLSDLRLYPAGVDPLEQSDRDTTAGWCDTDYYGPEHTRHRFAPYLPPVRPETEKLVGRVVRVELSLQKDERTA